MTSTRSDVTMCECIANVDMKIFVHYYTAKWLNGQVFSSNREPQFYCTNCGPPLVLQSLQENNTGINRADDSTTKSLLSTKKYSDFWSSKSKGNRFSLNFTKLFSRSSSKKSDKESYIVPDTPLSTSTDTGASYNNHISNLRSDLSNRQDYYSEKEELPVTPRSNKLLFMCVTCCKCFCSKHVDHHPYSYFYHNNVTPIKHAECVNTGETTFVHYPQHHVFISVPQYVSTHPSHYITPAEAADYPAIFPVALIADFESRKADSTLEYRFYPEPEKSMDNFFFVSKSTNDSSSNAQKANYDKHETTHVNGVCSGSGVHNYGAKAAAKVSRSGNGNGAENAGKNVCPAVRELPPAEFYYTPTENWNFHVWCTICKGRPYYISGHSYDNKNPYHRKMRQFCQLAALLAYLRRRGTFLSLSHRPIPSAMEKTRPLITRCVTQGSSQKNLIAAEQHSGSKSVECPNPNFTDNGEDNSITKAKKSVHSTVETVLEQELLEKVLCNAKICGFSNPNFRCYMNAVLQCVLRCVFFTRPLMNIPQEQKVGKLTSAMMCLLQHLKGQTIHDIRTDAVHHFVNHIYKQVYQISSLFEEDEQQDAQEFLLCLLNGITDEFDKGKSEEEKKAKRISFEGALRTEVVCSRCHHIVPREEMFMSLSIPVEKTIDGGLKTLFTPVYLCGKNRYACEHCFKQMTKEERQAHNDRARAQKEERKYLKSLGKKVDESIDSDAVFENCVYEEAEMRTCITRLGGTLAIHLLRFHYDASVQDFIKVNKPVCIPMQLDLSSFVSDEVLKTYRCDRMLCRLKQRFPSLHENFLRSYLEKNRYDYVQTVSHLMGSGYGSATNIKGQLDIATPLIDTCNAKNGSITYANAGAYDGVRPLSCEPEEVQSNLSDISVRGNAILEISEEQFDAFGEQSTRSPLLVRRLVGIVSHRGSLHGGHYIAFVRNLSVPDVWFRCDDEDVEIVNESTVLQCAAEVYLAFYE